MGVPKLGPQVEHVRICGDELAAVLLEEPPHQLSAECDDVSHGTAPIF